MKKSFSSWNPERRPEIFQFLSTYTSALPDEGCGLWKQSKKNFIVFWVLYTQLYTIQLGNLTSHHCTWWLQNMCWFESVIVHKLAGFSQWNSPENCHMHTQSYTNELGLLHIVPSPKHNFLLQHILYLAFIKTLIILFREQKCKMRAAVLKIFKLTILWEDFRFFSCFVGKSWGIH